MLISLNIDNLIYKFIVKWFCKLIGCYRTKIVLFLILRHLTDNMTYLDYNSTTPTDQRVVNSMIPVFNEKFGNPSSNSHDTGSIARDLVEEARLAVASVVGMKPFDVVFTSGATEANNMVFYGLSDQKQSLHILVGSTEHKSVLEPCRFLAEQGATVKKIPVSSNGIHDLVALEDMLSKDNIDLVSVMAANSETGVISSIKKIVDMAHTHNALVHCDATQAIGKISFDAKDLDIDLITFSSHKIYGPKGNGALVATRYARKQMRALLHGGGQENNMRSGTLNVPGIVGFGKACEIMINEGLTDMGRQEKLRDYFETKITQLIPDVVINGKDANRLPNTSNMRIKGALADAIIVNAKGIEIATGSACASSTMEPSHVLIEMGLNADAANESIRVSIGMQTTQQDVDIAINEINKATKYLRGIEAQIFEGRK